MNLLAFLFSGCFKYTFGKVGFSDIIAVSLTLQNKEGKTHTLQCPVEAIQMGGTAIIEQYCSRVDKWDADAFILEGTVWYRNGGQLQHSVNEFLMPEGHWTYQPPLSIPPSLQTTECPWFDEYVASLQLQLASKGNS